MSTHLASSVERLIERSGSALTVRRKSGALDPITSTRTSPSTADVETMGVRRKRVQRSMRGDPLVTEEVYYLVPVSAFDGAFEPADADLVIDGGTKSRVMSVRRRERSGETVAFELYVSGVRG